MQAIGMQKTHYLLPILSLVTCYFAWGQDSAHDGPTPSNRPALRSVELVRTYRIQVPDDLRLIRFSDGSTRESSVPAYIFRGPGYIGIDVMILPYQSEVQRYGLLPIDETTGLFKLPFSINGSNPLAAHFKTARGGYVYYGWSTEDAAYACTMNSPCPQRTERSSRYQTIYTFVFFDKANDSIIEFTGFSQGRSKNVTEFQGDGKVLRDIITPSLAPIR